MGLISNELMKKFEIPYLSIDPIKMALHNSIPSYKLNISGSSIPVSEELWPFISVPIKNMLETGVNYIVEGEILPKHVRQLSEDLNIEIPTCFVGYSEIEPEDKVRQIRSNAGYPNDWTSKITDNELYFHVKRSIEYSNYLKKECIANQLNYIDFSSSFDKGFAEVLNYFSLKINN